MSLRRRVRRGVPGTGQFDFEPAPEFGGAPLSVITMPTIPDELTSPAWLGIDTLPDGNGVMLDQPHRHGGYDQIDRYEDGTIIFRRHGALHREDGPALCAPTSIPVPDRHGGIDWVQSATRRYFLNDAEVFDPSHGTGQSLDLELRSVDKDGTQHWWTTSGAHHTVVSPYKTVWFYLDGDLHRDGGPAVVLADGTGVWYRHGTLLAPGVPAESTIENFTVDGHYTSGRVGSKFNEQYDIRKIAAEVEKDMITSLRNGILPLGARTAVSYNAAKKEIGLRVSGIPDEYLYTNGPGSALTVDGQRIKKQLGQIVHAYWRSHEINAGDDLAVNFDATIQFA